MPDFALEEALAQAANTKLVITGDFALDAYWHLDPDWQETSLETGRDVQRVQRHHGGPGGAANLACNAADLGAATSVVGLVGDDLFGRELTHLLSVFGVDTEHLLHGPMSWDTTVFAKPHRNGDELERLDFGTANQLDDSWRDRLLEVLEDRCRDTSAIIWNQQIARGLWSDAQATRIAELAKANPDCVFLQNTRDFAAPIEGTVVVCNAHEAARWNGVATSPRDTVSPGDALGWAEALRQRTGRAAFVTCGRHGIALADTATELIGARPTDADVDPVGAGDTATAAIAAVLGGGGSPRAAAQLAVLAAAVTVTKTHTTGTASPDEIRELAS